MHPCCSRDIFNRFPVSRDMNSSPIPPLSAIALHLYLCFNSILSLFLFLDALHPVLSISSSHPAHGQPAICVCRVFITSVDVLLIEALCVHHPFADIAMAWAGRFPRYLAYKGDQVVK